MHRLLSQYIFNVQMMNSGTHTALLLAVSHQYKSSRSWLQAHAESEPVTRQPSHGTNV